MANSVLPYWDQNIDLDIAPWVPYGKDYSPVTVNSLCNPTLGGLAGLALEMKSEFLYMRSFQNGSIGTMARQNIIDPVRNSSIELGFTMVFAYSEQLEQSVLRLLHKYPGLMAGLTLCDIWRENVLVDECKVLMLVDEDPFFNETDFIEALYKTFQNRDRRPAPDAHNAGALRPRARRDEGSRRPRARAQSPADAVAEVTRNDGR